MYSEYLICTVKFVAQTIPVCECIVVSFLELIDELIPISKGLELFVCKGIGKTIVNSPLSLHITHNKSDASFPLMPKSISV